MSANKILGAIIMLLFSADSFAGLYDAQNSTTTSSTPTVENVSRVIPAGCSADSPIDSCAPTVKPFDCPSGRHWSNQGGNGLSHCVDNDPTCPFATSLTHDSLGNPSCVANTCPSNLVLQADGISCDCASGYEWNGSQCVVIQNMDPMAYRATGLPLSAVSALGATNLGMTYSAHLYCPNSTYRETYNNGVAVWEDTQGATGSSPSGQNILVEYPNLSVVPSGGTPPYSYNWTVVSATNAYGVSMFNFPSLYAVAIENPSGQTTGFHYYMGFQGIGKSGGMFSYATLRSTVTDSAGQSVSMDWNLKTLTPGADCM